MSVPEPQIMEYYQKLGRWLETVENPQRLIRAVDELVEGQGPLEDVPWPTGAQGGAVSVLARKARVWSPELVDRLLEYSSFQLSRIADNRHLPEPIQRYVVQQACQLLDVEQRPPKGIEELRDGIQSWSYGLTLIDKAGPSPPENSEARETLHQIADWATEPLPEQAWQRLTEGHELGSWGPKPARNADRADPAQQEWIQLAKAQRQFVLWQKQRLAEIPFSTQQLARLHRKAVEEEEWDWEAQILEHPNAGWEFWEHIGRENPLSDRTAHHLVMDMKRPRRSRDVRRALLEHLETTDAFRLFHDIQEDWEMVSQKGEQEFAQPLQRLARKASTEFRSVFQYVVSENYELALQALDLYPGLAREALEPDDLRPILQEGNSVQRKRALRGLGKQARRR